ncbi:protein phosphatase 2C domain-containing protein [Plantactinospora sp. KLBMP9567]|uniref:protein phosphatase 2C domain-containing protein n=1 Tax=Plantactinospora sp. KLBMP9567 TaxID=3085900 RepID=UPI00298289E6|nr:protein phosphatase 2C domain-containing protein [Plantactinospora sp. KLBMP9567]MDW5329546.1 protein phosphatase 2C domain-containing protein [Plantactinospora sp. KLBMP9567]
MAGVRGGLTMEVVFASSPGPGGTNEDALVAGADFAVVIDGATAEPDTDPGCVHGVRWFAVSVASELGRLLTGDAARALPLADVLHRALDAVGRSHAHTCDLTNPCSPSGTVAMVRTGAGGIEYLVLGDAAFVAEEERGEVRVVSDDRIRRFDDRPWAALRQVRNVPDGFWVAGSRPEAAHHAITGALPLARLSRAALLTDGASRLVERYGWGWPALLDLLETHGPADLIAQTRAAERATPPGSFPGKAHDDATAVLCRFPGGRQR